MQEQAQAFIDKYEASGDWSFDSASQTFLGGIDEDGNGTVALGSVASPGAEVIDTLAVDAGQFTATVAGTTATVVAAGGSNNAGGNNNAAAPQLVFTTLGSSWWNGSNTTLVLASYDTATKTAVFTQPVNTMGGPACLWDLSVRDSAGNSVIPGLINGSANSDLFRTANDGTTCTYTAYFQAIANNYEISIDVATNVFAITAGSWGPNKAFSIQ